MLIGEVATRSGVDPRTLRFWEADGLLADPGRTPGGYRDYDETVLARIAFIRQGQGAGLRLADIRQVLELRDSGQAPCGRVGGLLAERLAQVERSIAELEDLRDRLRGLLEGGPATAPDPTTICPMIQAG